MHIELTWSRPIPFSEIFSDQSDLGAYRTKGVYLWTDTTSPEFYNYIGRALGNPDLIARQRDHYLDVIGGRSVIPAHYRNSQVKWHIRNPTDYLDVILDRERFIELVDAAFRYLADISVRLCPLPDLDSGLIADIERNLIYQKKPWCNTRGIDTKPINAIDFTMLGEWPTKQ